jgi:hypothetical protein
MVMILLKYMKKLQKYKLKRSLFSCFSCKIVEFQDGEYVNVNELSLKLEEILFEMSQCKTAKECVNLLASFIDKDKKCLKE